MYIIECSVHSSTLFVQMVGRGELNFTGTVTGFLFLIQELTKAEIEWSKIKQKMLLRF